MLATMTRSRSRIKRGDQPERLRRVVVAVDPPGGASKANAECGIIVAALGADRHGYVLADLSGRMSPEQWARRVVEAYHGYKADKIVAEQNFGGAMVESTIRSIDSRVPIKMVVASRGKQIRAEPVASWYEQHRVHHVGEFPALEDQMTGWDPAESGPSPDRVDACVWMNKRQTEGVVAATHPIHAPRWRMRKRDTIVLSNSDRQAAVAIVTDRNSPQKHFWRAQTVKHSRATGLYSSIVSVSPRKPALYAPRPSRD
jgi:predicted phage terminase large subunit-like protein